jgi:hypothetical protein
MRGLRSLVILAAVAAVAAVSYVPAAASGRELRHTCAVGRVTVSAASYASCSFARATFILGSAPARAKSREPPDSAILSTTA